MSATQPFDPAYGTTQNLTATGTSASATIDARKTCKQVRILNTGANICYVRISTGATTATTADYPVAAGQCSVITKFQEHDVMAYISAAGTTISVTLGEGW